MADISYTGTKIVLTASTTGSGKGFILTAFPKDVDPMEISDVEICDAEMGVNGDIVSWQVASPIDVNLAVIPNTADHEFLSLILANNRTEKDSIHKQDVITLLRKLPNGETTTLWNGRMLSGSATTSLTSSGRIKTVTYKFRFGKMMRTPSLNFSNPLF